QIPIFGGEYNAHGTSLEEVGRTFVPPKVVFENFIRPSNVLLMGPRGAGKTTLMKMLTGPALEHYTGPNAQEYRERIQYSGIFVPGDLSWSRQLGSLQLGALEGEQFAVSVFILHCLAALVDAASQRTKPQVLDTGHRRVLIENDEQVRLARDVARL